MAAELPRFPELLLDGLLAMLPLPNVLALTSVDRRESIGRKYLINHRSRVWFGHREHPGPSTRTELDAFHLRFPLCLIRQHVKPSDAVVPFARSISLASDSQMMLSDAVALATGMEWMRWPTNLESVFFGHAFNRSLAGLPDTVRHIAVSYHFNRPLSDGLPPNLLSLETGFLFNQLLAGLPTTVTSLKLGNSFRQPLLAADLPSIRHLSVGRGFNLPLPSLTTLVRLELTGFDRPLDECDLPNLRSLSLSGPFDRPLPPSLAAGLRSLTLGRQFDHPIDLADMPHLEHLELGDGFDSELDLSGAERLRTLTLGHGFTRPLHELPDSLVHLQIGFEWAGPLPACLPPKLATLSLHHSFVGPLPPIAALTALRVLKLGRSFDHPLALPDGLVHLEIGDTFDQPLALPASLQRCVLGAAFDHAFSSLPTALQRLTLMSRDYAHALPPLPASLEQLEIDVSVLERQGASLAVPPACKVTCRRKDAVEAQKEAARRWRTLALFAAGVILAIYFQR